MCRTDVVLSADIKKKTKNKNKFLWGKKTTVLSTKPHRPHKHKQYEEKQQEEYRGTKLYCNYNS